MAKSTPVHDESGRQCSGCRRFLPWTNFSKLCNGFRGYRARCKSCTALHDLPPAGSIGVCDRCGSAISLDNGRRFCSALCIQRAWKDKGRKQRTCESCGVPVGPRRHYCDECRDQRRIVSERWGHLQRKFGLDEAAFFALLAIQDGRCAICLSSDPQASGEWHVDHDHLCCPGTRTCGKCVRGLLCFSCNTKILAGAGDDPEILERAARYLRNARSMLLSQQTA